MDLQLFRKCLLVDIGNLVLQQKNVQLLEGQQNILISNEIKYTIYHNGKLHILDDYQSWINSLKEETKAQSFRLFFLEEVVDKALSYNPIAL